MSIEVMLPELQLDGTYRIRDPEPVVAATVWGTVRYWARLYGLLEVMPVFKERLVVEFPCALFVEEGGCEYLIFPEKAAIAVRDRFLSERTAAVAEREGWRVN